jgi:predicted RecB family nuclease
MKITKKIFKSYSLCPHKTHLLLKGETGNRTEYEVMFKEISERYCAEGLKRISGECVQVEKIRESNLKDKEGTVYQTSTGQLEVYSDLFIVERLRGGSALGTYYYSPIIFTPNEKLSKEDSFEIAYDAIILEALQARMPEHGKAVHGNGFRTSRVKIGSQIEKVKNIIAKIRKIDLGNPPKMILNRHCYVCEFKDSCRIKAVEKDDLSLITGISQKEIETQNKKGIFTVTQYSHTFRPRKRFKKAYPFNLKALAIRENKVHVLGSPEIAMPINQIYLDLEGDPDRDFYYLMGMIIVRDGVIESKYSFWADDLKQEETIIHNFLDAIRSYSDFKVFHYGSYEAKFFSRLQKFALPEDVEVISSLVNNSLNVLSLIYANVFFPTYSNGLKDIGTYLGVKWTSENASGIQSLVWRKNFEICQEQTIKNKLIEYNIEDCLALKCTTEFINRISTDIREDSNNNTDVVSAHNIKEGSRNKWGKVVFVLEDLERINNCAYFDYQREKIFVRTIKKLSKVKPKSRKKPKRTYPVNKHINVKFRIICPKCRKRMYRWIKSSKQVIDLKISKTGVKRWIEFYQLYKNRCPRCNSSLTDKTLRELPKYGHNLKSWVIYNHVINHQPFDKISDTLKDFFDLSISGPCLHYFKKYLSDYYYDN